MIPIFIWLFFHNAILAALVFILACITDVIDGYVARKYKVVSRFGMLFDPLADKLLQISAMVCLFDILPKFVIVVVITKEILMMCGALYLLKRDIIVPANKLGKVGTVVTAIAIVYLIAFGKSAYISPLIWALVLLVSTIGTFIGYIIVFKRKLEQ